MGSNLALEVEKWDLVFGNCGGSDGDLRSEELGGGATTAGSRFLWSTLRSLLEGSDDSIVEILDSAALIIANFGLRLNELPEIGEIGGKLHNVNRGGGITWSGHLLDVGLHLAAVFTDDLVVDDVTSFRDLGVWSGGESD
jgi:hypothetical protein